MYHIAKLILIYRFSNECILMSRGNLFVGCDEWHFFLPITTMSYIYVQLPVSIIGIILNVVSAFVLGRDKTMKHTTRFLLQMLAVADCVYLVSAFYNEFSMTIINTNSYVYLPYIVSYGGPCAEITLNAAVWMIVLVTAERYVAVCWPLYAPRYITVTRVRLAVGINWFVSFALYVIFYMQVESLVIDERTCFTLGTTPLYDHMLTYQQVVHSIMTFVLPLLCLCFFNISIVKALRKSLAVNRERLGVGHNGPTDDARMANSEHRCTKTMIAVVMVFLVCQLPEVVLQIVTMPTVISDFKNIFVIAFDYCMALSTASPFANSACNFFLYFLVGKRCRQILLGSLQRCRQRND